MRLFQIATLEKEKMKHWAEEWEAQLEKNFSNM